MQDFRVGTQLFWHTFTPSSSPASTGAFSTDDSCYVPALDGAFRLHKCFCGNAIANICLAKSVAFDFG
jgi:hypothetical protein